MSWFARAALGLTCLLLCGDLRAQSTPEPGRHDWKTYTNVRFAYSLCYPRDLLLPRGEPDNSDGQKFVSEDGQVQALVYGSNQDPDSSIKDVYLDRLRSEAEAGAAVSYKLFKPHWFVLSGTAGDRLFFEKDVLADGVLKTFRIDYPQSQKDEWNSLAAKMSGCFKTNLKSGVSR